MRLKIALMILILAGLGTVQASAQSAVPISGPSFDMGFESGMNFSYFLGTDAENLNPSSVSSSRLGFVGGAFLSLNFGPNFGIRPEALYEQKGAQITGTSTTYEVDYVEVPVLLKIGLGLPVVNPSLLIGPSFNWSVLASLPSGSGSLSSEDVGLVGGLEFDFGNFCLNGRYELGLDNVSENKNLQNGTFTILMGYSFI